MIDLLQRVLAEHGGLDRWNTFKRVSATIVSGGELWAAKGIKVGATPRQVTAAIDRAWTTAAPYGNPDWRMTFVPERVAIETSNNSTIGERDNPRASFAAHKYETPWDHLHRAYFSGYAMWTYLNTPFLMALPGFAVEEIAPWQKGGEIWRGLRAKFPATLAATARSRISTSALTSCCAAMTTRSISRVAFRRPNMSATSPSLAAFDFRQNGAPARAGWPPGSQSDVCLDRPERLRFELKPRTHGTYFRRSCHDIAAVNCFRRTGSHRYRHLWRQPQGRAGS
jgi:hypothetical protein